MPYQQAIRSGCSRRRYHVMVITVNKGIFTAYSSALCIVISFLRTCQIPHFEQAEQETIRQKRPERA